MLTGINEISVYELAGLVGVVFYLGSYAALQLKVIDSSGLEYPIFNFAAASCVLFSLFESFNMSSALIQVSWIAISGYGILALISTRLKTNAEG